MKIINIIFPLFLFVSCSGGDSGKASVAKSRASVENTMKEIKNQTDKIMLQLDFEILKGGVVNLENAIARYEDSLKIYNDKIEIFDSTYGTIKETAVAKQVLNIQKITSDIKEIAESKAVVLDRISEIEKMLASHFSLIAEREREIAARIRAGKEDAKAIEGYTYTRKHFETKASALVQTRRLIELSTKQIVSLVTAVIREFKDEIQLPEITLPEPTKKIEMSAAESKASKAIGESAATARDANGNLQSFKSKDEVVNFAQSNHFDLQATETYFDLTQSTGGRIAFAKGADQVGDRIIDMLTHMKADLAKGSDDLELVLGIDISQSMDNDISDVITKLKELVVSLDAIKKSGRKVKVGIVTFGLSSQTPQGKNSQKNTATSMRVPLTENLIQIGNSLQSILTNWTSVRHSDDPGEASYEGLSNAAKLFSSKSGVQKKIIVVTDEGSKEVAEGWTDYINSVNAELKKGGVSTSIYTILTQ
jgi:hypothetical protein